MAVRPIGDLHLAPALVELVEVVSARWFAIPVVGLSAGEGYAVDTETGQVSFGLRLGPTTTISGVLHDMGHFVTVAEPRIARTSFGMRRGLPSFCLGQVFHESVPLSAYLAELDAMVHERLLQAEVGAKVETVEETVSSLVWMPSFFVVPGDDDRARLRWLAEELERRADGVGIEAFDVTWFERVSRLPALIAEQAALEAFWGRADYEDVETFGTPADVELVVARASDGVDERFCVLSDVGGVRMEHGDYDDVGKAHRLVRRIMNYNGWDAEPSLGQDTAPPSPR